MRSLFVPIRPFSLSLSALCLILLTAGCEEDIIVPTSEYPFTLYGILNPRADTQWVRVFPIAPSLKITEPGPIDAVFTSTEVETGAQHAWRDSLIQFPDGAFGHVFYARFRARYAHTYTLEAKRADGAASTATVSIPVSSDPAIPNRASPSPSVTFAVGESFLSDVVVEYNVCAEGYGFLVFQRPYDAKKRRTPAGWELNVDLRADNERIRGYLDQKGGGPPYLLLVNVRGAVFNKEWAPPGGVFDPEILIQPGTFTNVENGFGVIAGGYRAATAFRPESEPLHAAGFLDRSDLPPGEPPPGLPCAGPGDPNPPMQP